MSTKKDLQKLPLIPGASLGLALNSGPYAVKSAAQRLGIKPIRMPNRRSLFTFEQAEAIGQEMLRQAG